MLFGLDCTAKHHHPTVIECCNTLWNWPHALQSEERAAKSDRIEIENAKSLQMGGMCRIPVGLDLRHCSSATCSSWHHCRNQSESVLRGNCHHFPLRVLLLRPMKVSFVSDPLRFRVTSLLGFGWKGRNLNKFVKEKPT